MKKILINSIMFFVMCQTTFSQIIQIGLDIDGIVGDQSGYAISLNQDGTRVAVGSPFNNDNGQFCGAVRIYEYSGVSWYQLGQTIYGNVQDNLGASLSLNSNGNRLAIGIVNYTPIGGNSNDGAVEVYEFNGVSWLQLGQTIIGENPNDLFGFSVDINSNGNRIVASAEGNDDGGIGAGSARAYEYNGTNWVQLGQDVDGTSIINQGEAVSLDPAGDFFAFGGSGGIVQVYSFDGTNWNQFGNDIIGQTNSFFGRSLCLSTDAEKIAIGAPRGGTNQQGSVQVFQIQQGEYLQIGQSIFGNNGDEIGDERSLKMDNFGDRIVIGSRYSDVNGISSGKAMIYDLIDFSWILYGEIIGESAGDEMGQATISGNGQRVALGARKNNGGGNNSGHVRIYGVGAVDLFENGLNKLRFFPNPSDGLYNLEADVPITLIEVYDFMGRKIDSIESVNSIESIFLIQPKGVYFLKIFNYDALIGESKIEIQ